MHNTGQAVLTIHVFTGDSAALVIDERIKPYNAILKKYYVYIYEHDYSVQKMPLPYYIGIFIKLLLSKTL